MVNQSHNNSCAPRDHLLQLLKLKQARQRINAQPPESQVICDDQDHHEHNNFQNVVLGYAHKSHQKHKITKNSNKQYTPRELNTTSQSSTSSIENKIQMTKRSNLQEQLFKMSCEQSKSSSNSASNHELSEHNRNYSSRSHNSSNGYRSKHFRNNMPASGSNNFNSNSVSKRQTRKLRRHTKRNIQISDSNDSDINSEPYIEKVNNNFNNPALNSLSKSFKNNGLNYLGDISSKSSENSAPSSYPHRLRRFDDDKDDHSDDVPTAGVLHLKGSLVNETNESDYLQNRGRMEHINWSDIDSNGSSSKKSSPQNQKVSIEDRNEIYKILESKPQISDEFSNAVAYSVEKEESYDVRGNLEYNKNDESILLRIQRMLRQRTENIAIMSNEIKKCLKQPREEHSNILNKIDNPKESVKTIHDKNMKEHKPPIQNKQSSFQGGVKKRYFKSSKESENKQLHKELPNMPDKINNPIEFIKSIHNKALHEKKPTQNKKSEDDIEKQNSKSPKESKNKVTGYDCDTLGTLTREEVKLKHEKRMKEMAAYSDDDFNFIKSELSSSLLYPTVHGNRIIDNNLFNEKIDSTLDSDDISSNQSSMLDDLSVSKQSTSSIKFESIRRKLLGSSTEVPVKHKSQIDSTMQPNDKVMKLMSKDSSETVQNENKVFEITNVSIHSKELLKAKSTRYFTKVSKVEKENIIPIGTELVLNPRQTNNQVLEEVESNTKKSDSKNKVINESYNSTNKTEDYSENGFLTANDISLENPNISKSSVSVTDLYQNKVTEENKNLGNIPVSLVLEEKLHINTVQREVENKTATNSLEITREDDFLTVDASHEKEDTISNHNDSHEVIIDDKYKCALIIDNFVGENSVIQKIELSESDEDNRVNELPEIKEPLIIEEIDSKSNNELSYPEIMSQYRSDTDEDVLSYDDFDIVNFEEFPLFKSLSNKLIGLQTLQKARATGMLEDKPNNDDINNNSQSRYLESSPETSEDNFNTANGSSNLNTDDESRMVSNYLDSKTNIFENLIIDPSQLSNLNFSHGNISETTDTAVSIQTMISNNIEQNGVPKTSAKKTARKTIENRFSTSRENEEKSEISRDTIVTGSNQNITHFPQVTAPVGTSKRMQKYMRVISKYKNDQQLENIGTQYIENNKESSQLKIKNELEQQENPTCNRIQILEAIKKSNLHLSMTIHR